MSVIMQLHGTAMGEATPFDGQFLKAFDFEADGGTGLIDMTPDKAEAKRFDTLADAMTFYQTSPKCQPFRPYDGKPNRPLTATNWGFENVGS